MTSPINWHVVLQRDAKGRLTAQVIQDGKRGADLLADRVCRDIAIAKQRVNAALHANRRGITITWEWQQ